MSVRRLTIIMGAALSLLALPGAAHAATASISGSQVVVSAGANESNELYVSDTATDVRIQEAGFFVSLSPGAGCVSGGLDVVLCPRAGIASVTVSMGDRSDDFFSSSTLPLTVNAGTGNDELIGGPAADTLNGGDDDDAMDGGLGADTLNGGNDTLDPYGNGGDWVTYQFRTADVTADLAGDAGDGQAGENDTVAGDIEHLVGGSGDDTLTGDAGQNIFEGGTGADVFRGGGGIDWALYWNHSLGATVTLDGVANDGYASEGDNVESGVENLIGGSGPDKFTGDDSASMFFGQSGNDVLDGGGGADVLDGSIGTDTVSYASHSAAVTADLDGEADDGAPGEGDTIETDVEHLIGGSGGDTLTGNIAVNTLNGGDGDDLLDGAGGGDELNGGSGADTATYAARTVPVTADPDGVADDGAQGENDNVGTDVEGLVGGSAADTLSGNDGDNELDGGPGADVMNGGAGSDTVTYASRTAPVTAAPNGNPNNGEAGEGDTVGTDVEALVGGSANDTLTGSDGANKLVGGDGDDTLDAGNGSDELDSGAGADTLRARDGAVDALTCGSETDSLEVDSNDDTASDCEGVEATAPATASASVSIGARKLRINRRGVALVPVRCALLEGICRGTVVMTVKRVKKTTKGRVNASRRSRPKRAVIGRASFKAEAGETVKVKVKLSHNGRRRVLRNRKLRCRASVKTVAEDGTKNVVEKALTLLAPKKEASK